MENKQQQSEYIVYQLVVKKEDYQNHEEEFKQLPINLPVYNHKVLENLSYDKLIEMNLEIKIQEKEKEKENDKIEIEQDLNEGKQQQQKLELEQNIDDLDFDQEEEEQEIQEKKEEILEVLQDDETFELLKDGTEDDNDKDENLPNDPTQSYQNQKYTEQDKINSRKKFSLWLNTPTHGKKVQGTNFIPGKTPLLFHRWKPLFDNEEERRYMRPMFEQLQQEGNQIKLVIDLTEVNKFYTFWKCKKYQKYGFTEVLQDCEYVHYPISAKTPPRKDVLNKIYNTLNKNLHKKDFNVFIHCFCGLNRTGYVIAYFLCKKYNISSKEAISRFEESRGCKFDNQMLIEDLQEKFDY